MPYTPPSHCSPPASAPNSPDVSRRSSFNSGTITHPRPALPRSASYLTRHRRSISATAVPTVQSSNHGSTPDITPLGTSDNLKELAATNSSTIRQSPPPVADAKAMPPGAIISPPESSSEDEGVPDPEERGREIENIKELKEAISAIPQCRVGSPNRISPGGLMMLPSQIDQLVETPPRPSIRTTDLKKGRPVSHSRSNTDTHIYFSKSADTSLTSSEESSEQDESMKKPPMVRKKSGELVRPALRPAHLRRPSSMPGTPTFSKAVHFDSHLEHVRHFLQVDRPLAVSTGSSPVDNYDSDTEYPFKSSDKVDPRSPPYEWEIVVNNFPSETPIRKGLPVRLERVWMSPDQKSLMGSICVANLAFQKSVVCRFTFDYWKTTSEIGAEYHHEIRPRDAEIGHDRFQFSIKLSDVANLETKTLYFCVRYNVNGLEYWDNNDHINFQVDFRKKFVPRNGKKGPQGASSRAANALPRSNRRTNPSTVPRPRSMPVGALDEFGKSPMASMDQPIHEFLGESEPTSLRLKSSKSTTSLPSDNLPGRLSTPSGVAFANRYDFGASLSAAKQAQKSPNSSPRQNDGLYMKAHQRKAFDSSMPSEVPRSQSNVIQVSSFEAQQSAELQAYTTASLSPGAVNSSSASIASASYEEILNKYCFFNGSKQSSPQLKDGTLQSGRYDGADEYSIQRPTSDHSSLGGNPSSMDRPHHGAAHHTLHQTPGLFQDVHFTTVTTSLAESPLQSPAANTPTGNYLASPSTTPNGPVPGRTQYRHIQHMQDRPPFTSDTHPARVISC
ncbi:putative phosphatase regulatory subunit-domain-containing protein [Nemania abortiva]|nr:putative phosphatase regulatory subunit-domain-containing protein [Nemania abortiva]